MTSPTDLAERLRDGCAFRKAGIPACEPGDARCIVCEAADALDRLSALESASPQREKNVTYVIACMKAALANGYDFKGSATIANWLDFLEGRENAPAPNETWSEVRQPESGASGDVTDEEVNRLCQFWFAPVEPEEDRFKGSYAQGFIERMKAAVVAVLGPRLAKAEQRVKELEAVCAEAYQAVGVLATDATFEHTLVIKLLDNLSACANGERPIHETFLPFVLDNPSSEPAQPAPSDGAHVDPWDALTDSERIAYLERAAYQGQGITYEAAFAIAQRMARDDAKKGET